MLTKSCTWQPAVCNHVSLQIQVGALSPFASVRCDASGEERRIASNAGEWRVLGQSPLSHRD
jgi:hypothetical protein